MKINNFNDFIKTTKQSFIDWKSIFDKYLNEMISEISEDYLDKLNLKVQIDHNYKFDNKSWFASYEYSSNKISQGIIMIAINYHTIYNEMCKRKIDKDRLNIEAQARITVGHEIGHGLVDYLVNYYDGENEDIKEFVHDYYDGEFDEEDIVEEFGESMFPEVTKTYNGILRDVLDKI